MPSESLSRPQPLSTQHDVSTFDCGKAPLNEFLKKYALANQSSGNSRTFVVTNDENRVKGYYSLSATSLVHKEVPERVSKGQPGYPIPAILMARFAIDLEVQGMGIGKRLFRDALLRSLSVQEEVGIRAFVVDAKDTEAQRFYSQNFEMMSSEVNPSRLYLLFKDVRKLIGP